MNPAQSRLLGLALIALAVVGWSWSFDQRQRSQALRESLTRLVSQRDLLLQDAATPLPVVRQQLAVKAADRAAVRHAAAGFGSDARNLAAALGRVSMLCSAAGLVECQTRRATSGGALGPDQRPAAGGGTTSVAQPEIPEKRMTSYAVTMLATFNPKGLNDFLRSLRSLDVLFRIERLVIMQNRMELDLIFVHSDEIRSEVRAAAGRLEPRQETHAR